MGRATRSSLCHFWHTSTALNPLCCHFYFLFGLKKSHQARETLHCRPWKCSLGVNSTSKSWWRNPPRIFGVKLLFFGAPFTQPRRVSAAGAAAVLVGNRPHCQRKEWWRNLHSSALWGQQTFPAQEDTCFGGECPSGNGSKNVGDLGGEMGLSLHCWGAWGLQAAPWRALWAVGDLKGRRGSEWTK